MEKYLDLIARGKITQAISSLEQRDSLDAKSAATLVLIKARLATLKKQQIEGTISSADANVERQNISKSLLDFIHHLEDQQAPPPPFSTRKKVVVVLLSLLVVLTSSLLIFTFFQEEETPPDPPEEPVQTEEETPPSLSIQPGKVANYTLSDLNYEMVLVERDTFLMGNNGRGGVGSERPVHPVLLDSFYIGKYEITQFQWETVMNNNPSSHENCPECPVENISWYDIQQFIQKLNALSGLNCNLPTEAQWEYAAKGGKYHQGYQFAGTNEDSLNGYSWYRGNPNCFGETKKVGGLKPNELGLYDMAGNVHEGCVDWFDYYYYTPALADNPAGPDSLPSTIFKVCRGGAFNREAQSSRVCKRGKWEPIDPCDNIGFRLVLNL